MPSARTRHAVTAPTARRADARRNIEAILDAAERCLAADPDASMSDVAREASLGRVTIYGHFKTRAELIELVVRRVLDEANTVLADVDLTGDAADALARLVRASWEVTVRSGSLVVAAEKALPPLVVRELHAGELEDRVRELLAGAQRAGAFRSDLSTEWLVAMFHATLHAAANEIAAGRLQAEEAAGVITATLLGAYRAPARRAPGTSTSTRRTPRDGSTPAVR
jgi:TetR/AcrR family transcriptional regulator, mexCD-oprJ operon repressor